MLGLLQRSGSRRHRPSRGKRLMRFGMLGPVLVGNGAAGITIGSATLRVLLAALVLEAPRPVSVERLQRALWGVAPPASARASLHNHIRRLRRLLADEAPGAAGMIEAVPGGTGRLV